MQEELVSLIIFYELLPQSFEFHANVKFFCPEQEVVRKMPEALMEGEEAEDGGEEERTKSSLRKKAIADVAGMKRLIEEQLQLEREREAETDDLHW